MFGELALVSKSDRLFFMIDYRVQTIEFIAAYLLSIKATLPELIKVRLVAPGVKLERTELNQLAQEFKVIVVGEKRSEEIEKYNLPNKIIALNMPSELVPSSWFPGWPKYYWVDIAKEEMIGLLFRYKGAIKKAITTGDIKELNNITTTIRGRVTKAAIGRKFYCELCEYNIDERAIERVDDFIVVLERDIDPRIPAVDAVGGNGISTIGVVKVDPKIGRASLIIPTETIKQANFIIQEIDKVSRKLAKRIRIAEYYNILPAVSVSLDGVTLKDVARVIYSTVFA